jgi:polysaccharide biosynthesis transport protein
MANHATRSLPTPGPPPAALAPIQGVDLMASPAGYRGDDFSQAGLPFSHYSWLLRTHFIKMLAFVILSVLGVAFVTLRLTPIYESTATLYVDRTVEQEVVGKDQQAAAQRNTDADAFLTSQIGLLQSDAVVRPMAEKYNLLEKEKQITPGKDDPQKIQRIRNSPIVLKGLRISRPANTYILHIAYRADDAKIATEVANGIANSYIEHLYDIRLLSSASVSKFLSRQLDEFRAKMETSAERLATLERELNVINPEEKTSILSTRLLQLNTEYTKVQAQRALTQSMYNSLSTGSLEAALGSSQSEELRGIIKRLNEERQRFADVKARYGDNHPEYARLQSTVQELENQVQSTVKLLARQAATESQRAQDEEALIKKDVDDTKAQYDEMNLRSFEYQRAKQEAEADRGLYEELVKKVREGEINSGFHDDTIRFADYARPGSKPVFPSLPLNLAVAFFLSSLVAVAAVIISDRIDTTIKNPDEVTYGLKSRVLGALPALPNVKKRLQSPGLAPSLRRYGDGLVDTKAQSLNTTVFEEAIRTIRNSILLTDFDRSLRSILMTSATPSEGKSTVAAHLAVAHAEQRHRTLVIDGDMRRPSLHKLMHVPNTAGLSTAIEQNVPWRELLIQPQPDLDLFILPAGPSIRRAADRIGQFIPQLLAEAAEEFDLTILDAPPLLGFPEPLQMAAAADGVIIVTRAGQTDRSAIAAVLDTLSHLRTNVLGVVLNEVRKQNSSSYYYYGGNYGKYYSKREADGD